jgi:hypothetical protein
MKTGNPNGAGLPEWPKYSTANGETMVFDDACEAKNDPDREARKALPIIDVETTIERITPRKGCDTVFSDRAQTAGGDSSMPDGAAHQPASDTNRTSCLNRSILRF